MEKFQELMKEIAKEENIEYSLLSDDFVIELKKKNVKKYIYAYKFPLNDHGIGLILDDKYAFYSTLLRLNIKTVKTKAIFSNYQKEDLLNDLNTYKKLIVKANNGTCGKEVFKVETKEELFTKIDFLLNKNAPVCLSPYYSIKSEYRVIVLNKQVKLIYGKKRPIIVGDGKRSVFELLKEFNPYYYQNQKHLKKIPVDLEKVLQKGESLEIDFKFNLSNGATIFEVKDVTLKEKLTCIALFLVNHLNIQFASIDIIETYDKELLVLEANSGVMMDNFIELQENGREIAKTIYKEAIETLFKE